MSTIIKSLRNRMVRNCGVGLWLLPLFLIISSQLHASEMNLATAISLMSEQNPALNIFEVKKKSLEGKQLTAALNPAFELAVEADNFTGSKPYNSFEQSEVLVSLSSVIELGGKKDARKQFARSQFERLNEKRRLKSLNLIAELTGLYIDILATQKRIELADESVSLSKDIYAAVKRKAQAGAISGAEVKRAYAALEQAQISYQAEQNKLQRQHVNLSLYWSEKNPGFKRLSGDLFDFGHIKNIDLLLNNLEQSSIFQLVVLNRQIAKSKLNLVKAESKTDVSWSVGIRRFEESNDAALSAGISVPLFKSKRNKGALIEAEADVDSFYSEQKITLLNLYGRVNELYSLRQSAIQQFTTLEEQVIPALSDALKLIGEAYLQGRYGYLEYSAARAELIQSKKSLIETAQNILKYNVKLEAITADSIFIKTQTTQGADT